MTSPPISDLGASEYDVFHQSPVFGEAHDQSMDLGISTPWNGS